MLRRNGATASCLVVGLVVLASSVSAQDSKRAEREAMYQRYLDFPSTVTGGAVQPHWMADGSSFWYAEGEPGNRVIDNVDPKANGSVLSLVEVKTRHHLS